jgi:arsenite methyltransferase
MNTQFDTHGSVQEYYGKVLKSSADLKTGACCATDSLPSHVLPILGELHEEVRERFYGCGSPIPPALEGATVLDLGCGSGRDSYLMSKLVGPEGRVIGVDMTEEQLAVARRHVSHHARKFGHSNVEFVRGYIEDLVAAGVRDASVDVVISNCVLNLSPDKPRVFREIFRVLKPGGELHFSDVFADRRVPAELARDPQMLGECLGGALYVEDFRRLIAEVGCLDARVCASSTVPLTNADVRRKAGNVGFRSLTIRAFKLDLEDRCEDYGQVATYRGTIGEQPHSFDLDDHHHFEAGRPMLVCGNTADMLSATRYGRHFDVRGDKRRHFGLFDCAPASSERAPSGGACC